jgi:hypothetical protein
MTHDVIKILFQHLPGIARKQHEQPSKIRNESYPNTILEYYLYTKVFGLTEWASNNLPNATMLHVLATE